eukprot:TRINITY_DN2930_c0_g1_i1.p1 TRINITY_DN2930_c0_g1~~TRINITY_DN2930_c0_g1_i1.p1  ORF type:complete len:762 (+),score=168.11 TRINITY_DN2930_c0_g1_i1:196-2481(+)
MIAFWMNIPLQQRNAIKEVLVGLQADETRSIRMAISQVIAIIAVNEVPRGQWPTILDSLLSGTSSDNLLYRSACLCTLGSICDEDYTVLKAGGQHILTAIMQNLSAPDSPLELRKISAFALSDCLELCQESLLNPSERRIIIQTLIQVAGMEDEELSSSAYEILIDIVPLVYEKLADNLADLFALSVNSIKNCSEHIVKMAIEFWIVVCEEELSIIEEGKPSQNYVKFALGHLVAVLIESMNKFADQYADPDEYNVSSAASNCLSQMTAVVKEDIIPHTLPYIEQNFTSDNAALRDTAILVFRCIVDLPGCADYVKQAIPVLLQNMSSSETKLKDTTSWTIGMICKKHPDVVKQGIDQISFVLCTSIRDDDPQVAATSCWALLNLAQTIDEENSFWDLLNDIIQIVLVGTERGNDELTSSCFESLQVIAANAPEKCKEILVRLMNPVIARLGECVLQLQNNGMSESIGNIQSSMCSLLVVLLLKLEDSAHPNCNQIAEIVFHILNSPNASYVGEEAILVIGAIAHITGEGFIGFANEIIPLLLTAMSQWQDHSICLIAISVISDITRALNTQFSPYADATMMSLMELVSHGEVDRSIPPLALSCMGDIAIAIGAQFANYLPVFLKVAAKPAIEEAVKPLPPDDVDYQEFIDELKCSIIEAFTGIIHGLRTGDKSDLILKELGNVAELLLHIAKDKPENRSEALTNAAIGLIGDITMNYGHKSESLGKNEDIQKFIVNSFKTSKSAATQSLAKWAATLISRL